MRSEQIEQLQAALPAEAIKQVDKGSYKADYIDGFTAISAANRIFGFDGWSTEVVDLRCVVDEEVTGREGQIGRRVGYIAKVRVTLNEGSLAVQVHEDVGSGEGIDYNSAVLAHESAVKEAVTDAEKRALRHWGNQFGLSLYDKDRDRPQQRSGGGDRKVTNNQLNRMWAIAHGKGLEGQRVRDYITTYAEKPQELTMEQYDAVVAWIEEQGREEQQE